MKNLKLISLILIAFSVLSCNKEDEEGLLYEGPSYVGFMQESSLVTAFVDNSSYQIAIGVTATTEKDRSFTFELTDSGDLTEGVEFTIATDKVVIKAGEVIGSIDLDVDFDKLPSDGGILAFEIIADDTQFADFSIKTHEIEIGKFCAFNISDFAGDFDCDEPGYDHYDVELTQLDDNTIISDNFWDSGWEVEYVFSGDDEQNVTITEFTYVSSSGSVYVVTGAGKYNTCTNSFFTDYLITRNGDEYETNTHTFVSN